MSHVVTILSFDPGQTTGFALTHLHDTPFDDVPGLHSHRILGGTESGYGWATDLHGHFAFEHAENMVDQLVGTLKAHADAGRRVVIVAEKFVITVNAVKGNSTWSSEVIGMIKQRAYADGYTVDTSQMPSSMKNLIHKSKVLEELGVKYRGSGMSPHTADALGHALLFSSRVQAGNVKL